MFEQSFVSPPARTRTVWTVAVSFGAQIAGIAVAIVIPMLAYEHLSPAFLLPPLVAPPRAPAPKSIGLVAVERPRPVKGPRPFVAPREVPREITMINDLAEAQQAGARDDSSTSGTVIGGVPNSDYVRSSRVIQPRLEQIPEPKRPAEQVTAAAPAPVAAAPHPVGGDVQAARLLNRVMPVYPPLARANRITGVVMLTAIISADGLIRELRVASGHPLLVPAAVQAVRQWTYRPTLLNGVPVEVITTIEVNFKLGQ